MPRVVLDERDVEGFLFQWVTKIKGSRYQAMVTVDEVYLVPTTSTDPVIYASWKILNREETLKILAKYGINIISIISFEWAADRIVKV